LGLILYADGISPGNALSHEIRRKSVVWYVSFMEFGHKLAYEEMWCAISLVRTYVLACMRWASSQDRGNYRGP
jgi:hypothetical protein